MACSTTARDGYGARFRAYETDLCDDAWHLVSGFLPDDPGGGRPRLVCLRTVADAVFYVLRSGCAWRMLPVDFPPWPTVYRYFRRWEACGAIAAMHDVLRGLVRADLRAVVDAIFYVLKTGCQWRLVPTGFPPWPTVYHYFRRWKGGAIWGELHDFLRGLVRVQDGRSPEPTVVSSTAEPCVHRRKPLTRLGMMAAKR